MNDIKKCSECNCCCHCNTDGCECGCNSCEHSSWGEETVDME